MSIIYRTLFEVRLLHEYFLTREDGSVIFDKSSQQKDDFLAEEFSGNRDPINIDVGFEFPQALKDQFDGSYLRIVPTYSGCKVVVKVQGSKQPDESILYRPLVPVRDDLNIYILLTRKGAVDEYTAGRLRRPLPSSYYFSNNNLLTPKTFPFLTNNVPAFDASFGYEQGELSLNGAIVQEFQKKGSPDVYHDITGSNFTTESDRLLLGTSFLYSFPDITGLTEASFVLKDFNGNQIDRLDLADAAGLKQQVRLDYSGKVSIKPIGDPFTSADILYTLEVSGDNGYSQTHSIILNPALLANNPWGIIHITPKANNAAYDLFESDGSLKSHKDPLGIDSPYPIFEIPVKSKLVFWRFINNRGKELMVAPALVDYVDKENKILITKTPRRLSRSYFNLKKESPAGEVYVPNPLTYQIKQDTNGRLCFDVMVSKSELFPIAP